jgi:hypothetical protein
MQKGGIDHGVAAGAALSTSVVAQPQPCGRRCSLSPWHGERTVVRLMLLYGAQSCAVAGSGVGWTRSLIIGPWPAAWQISHLHCQSTPGFHFTQQR